MKLKIKNSKTKSNQFPSEEENRSQDGRKKNLLDEDEDTTKHT